MEPVTQKFKEKSVQSLNDLQLQEAMVANQEFAKSTLKSIRREKEFEAMREHAKKIKDHTLSNLGQYLKTYEQQAKKRGIHVHWAKTSGDAQQIIQKICKEIDAKVAVCGKSMIGAEIDVATALKKEGIKRYETDLGEYILQLADDEPPSHINGPAIHKSVDQIRNLFHEHHKKFGFRKTFLTEPIDLLKETRQILRNKFLSADVGIIGANFLIAENGANLLVTNEGNGDLATLLPKTNIVLASIEKVLPRIADAELFLRLLCISATGQKTTAYQSFYFGKKMDDQCNGAKQTHVVLLDNGRSNILASNYWPILRCVRCGTCMDNCPVYNSIGGHPYGWIYPGPMGVIWSTQLLGMKQTADLPNACTLNGHCSEVCPMKIPLKNMIRDLRDDQWKLKITKFTERLPIRIWKFFVTKPKLYHGLMQILSWIGHLWGGEKGTIGYMPGAKGWTKYRDLPAPKKSPFNRIWRRNNQR